jgi:hypothetical protein
MDTAISPELVIKGLTKAGKTFRPSDWAERLAGVFSMMGDDHRMHYSDYVQPVFRAGLRCVVINIELESRNPGIYQFLMDFARANELEVVPGRLANRD